MTDKEILENILTAQVLLLSHTLNEQAKQKGTQRGGGDFTSEAIQQIKQKKSAILQKFLSTP